MDVIRLIQKSYKNSLASSKVLNCLSCGRGDANFEEQPRYVKASDNAFFVNKLPNTRSRQARFKKPRGQSAYVINKRMRGLGLSLNARLAKNRRQGDVRAKELRRPQTGVASAKETKVDYGETVGPGNPRNRFLLEKKLHEGARQEPAQHRDSLAVPET